MSNPALPSFASGNPGLCRWMFGALTNICCQSCVCELQLNRRQRTCGFFDAFLSDFYSEGPVKCWKFCISTVALETETSKKRKKIKNLAEFLYIVCCLATVISLLLVFCFSFFVSQIFCLCLCLLAIFPFPGLVTVN